MNTKFQKPYEVKKKTMLNLSYFRPREFDDLQILNCLNCLGKNCRYEDYTKAIVYYNFKSNL